jgi:hypothetical protein
MEMAAVSTESTINGSTFVACIFCKEACLRFFAQLRQAEKVLTSLISRILVQALLATWNWREAFLQRNWVDELACLT